MNNRLIKSNNAGGGGGCTDTVDLYNPFPDGGGVALYQLNGDATDESGNYNGVFTTPAYGTGEFGQAGVFNGSSSYISVPNSAGNNLTTISASCWFKKNAQGGTGVLMNNGGADGAAQQGWYLAILSSGFIRFSTSGSGDSSANVDGTINYADGIWHNVVLTHTAVGVGTGIYKIYIDGNIVISGSNSRFTSTATQPLVIGRFARAAVEYFNGSIDQVRIFSRALRPYEVEALYTEVYCTPTIVPSEHFNTVLFTGDDTASKFIDVGFTPDFIWLKSRDVAVSHALYDTVRGNNLRLVTNTTSGEGTVLNEFATNGFNIKAGYYNDSTLGNQVAWNFKAGGAAVSAVSIAATGATRSANPAAGFSIIKFQSSASTPTPPPMNYIEHGLDSTPKMVIYKTTNSASAWRVMHVDNGQKWIDLNSTAAAAGPFTYTIWDNTPTSIGARSNYAIGANEAYIAYCFAEVEGFSSFGSYVGNGTTSNNIVTGFEPAFLMTKRTDVAGYNWYIWDNKRNPTNPLDKVIYADSAGAEQDFSAYPHSFLENGFSVNSNNAAFNASGSTYIYMAFAADPTAVEPTLADSFNTVVYSGTGSNQSITGFGFKPDFIWVKKRDTAVSHHLFDTVRGNFALYSNFTLSEDNFSTAIDVNSATADGFDVIGNSGGLNTSGTNNYVAWCWKTAEIPAINSNGSIPSVVSANPAAGFSIVSFNGTNTSSGNVGHGLNTAPSIYFLKGRQNGTDSWIVSGSSNVFTTSNTDFLRLNTTDAVASTTANSVGSNATTINIGVRNNSTQSFIAYCFAEVAGFSKFGSYNGTSGNSVNTISFGFEPAFVMIKRTDSTGSWRMYDNKRDTGTLPFRINHNLSANLSSAEYDASGETGYLFFTSDGIQYPLSYNNTDVNGSGTYIYMAFANQF